MALPKQVQAQADALEQFERQVAEAQAAQPKSDEPLQPRPRTRKEVPRHQPRPLRRLNPETD